MAAASYLHLGCVAGRTAVLACRGELPLIIQRPLRGPSGQAVVTLLTPAGALFDGDAVQLSVDCEPGTDVTLTTAAATRLNRCDAGAITFSLQARVAANASFRYLPHELIPLHGARYRQHIELDIDGSGRAALMEVVGPGASATPFSYQWLQLATTLHVAGSLAVRERMLLTQESVSQLAGHTHYGSLLVVGSWRVVEPPPVSGTDLVGVSDLPTPGSIVKMVGASAQSVRAALLGVLTCSEWLQPLLPA